jgi:hypothetical protein
MARREEEEGTMTFDISNVAGLINAAKFYDSTERTEALILVLRTPGGFVHRFIFAAHGIEKQDCDQRGAAQ